MAAFGVRRSTFARRGSNKWPLFRPATCSKFAYHDSWPATKTTTTSTTRTTTKTTNTTKTTTSKQAGQIDMDEYTPIGLAANLIVLGGPV